MNLCAIIDTVEIISVGSLTPQKFHWGDDLHGVIDAAEIHCLSNT
jgi:hypothetical protein